MNTPSKEAIEAAEQIFEPLPCSKEKAMPIIQSAIEKAREQWLIEGRADLASGASAPAAQPQPRKHCPGPRQHGHPLIYESHCDHGEEQPHTIAASSEPRKEERGGLCECGHPLKEHYRFSDHDECPNPECECDMIKSTTGSVSSKEWTPEYVYELTADAFNESGRFAQVVCDAHNAALAAEREASGNWGMMMQAKLADERERRKLLVEVAEWAAKVLDLGESVQAEEILRNALASVKEQP